MRVMVGHRDLWSASRFERADAKMSGMPSGAATAPQAPSAPPWRPLTTAAAIIVSAVVAGCATFGVIPLAVAVAAAGALIVAGWVVLLNLPSPRGTATVLAASTAVMIGFVLVAGLDGLTWLPVAVALSLMAEFGHQLARRDGRPRLVDSVSATVAGIAVLASGVSMLPLVRYEGGPEIIVVVMVAAGVAALADVAVRWRIPAYVGALLAAVLGGCVAGVLTGWLDSSGVPMLAGVAVGAFGGSAGHLIRRVQSVLPYLYGRRAQWASGAGSVLMLGVLTHVAAWLGGVW